MDRNPEDATAMSSCGIERPPRFFAALCRMILGLVYLIGSLSSPWRCGWLATKWIRGQEPAIIIGEKGSRLSYLPCPTSCGKKKEYTSCSIQRCTDEYMKKRQTRKRQVLLFFSKSCLSRTIPPTLSSKVGERPCYYRSQQRPWGRFL